MESPVNNENLERLCAEQQKRIEALERALAEKSQRAQLYEDKWSDFFDQNKALRAENLELQHAYEQLRVQKGGFGFKMLLFSGLGGFFTALVLCFVYLKLKPKDPHTAALADFRHQHLFNYELALSQKRFGEVAASLEKSIQHPDYQPIKTDLVMLRELLEAAQKGCE
jgi:prefoldin subunit 5